MYNVVCLECETETLFSSEDVVKWYIEDKHSNCEDVKIEEWCE